ncbi:MAG: D-alanyl-D-alanine carboxypeptidase [Ahrensia sp.]|nr:D-alanyl-D-alanine carboxypeptidase [Ahrensia sp.]
MKRSSVSAPSVLSRLPVLCAMLAALTLVSACTTTSVLNTAPFVPPSARYAAIVVDGNSGRVLHSTRPDAIRFPASLTKMMTMLMLFEALDRGQISKSTLIPVSSRAARQPASKLWLKDGSSITVDKALQALAVKSANDVAYAVAEFLAGSEAAFARRMTAKARSFGMKSTTFRNASGLPDKRQVTTARDMAKLGIILRKRYPQHYHYFGRRSFAFRGKTIRGHNKVLGKVRGADGIKTGYTRASGFNLVTSVRARGKSVVGVILGENSGKSRDRHMVLLINRFLPSAGPR